MYASQTTAAANVNVTSQKTIRNASVDAYTDAKTVPNEQKPPR
jgi:hypothetical protein